MSKVYLSIDPGASQTKIIYKIDQQSNPQYFLMSPEVQLISKEVLKIHLQSKNMFTLINEVPFDWIEINNQIYVLGEAAQEFRLVTQIKELKYENAIYKTLGIIGKIVEDNLLTKKVVDIYLSVLLPANEYSDRDRFSKKLSQLVENYLFNNKRIKAKLKYILCRPEGTGIAALTIADKGLDWFKNNNVGILMMGHRNISGLVLTNGSLKKYDSPIIGFSNLFDGVKKIKSGLDEQIIHNAICSTLRIAKNEIYQYKIINNKSVGYTRHPDWREYFPIQNLATAKDKDLYDDEVNSISHAINIGAYQYWEKVSSWLNQIFDQKLNSVIIAGGASIFFEPELEKYFNCEPIHGYKFTNNKEYYYKTGTYKELSEKQDFVRIIWSEDIKCEIEKQLIFDQNDEYSTKCRLLDVYGLFNQLTNKY